MKKKSPGKGRRKAAPDPEPTTPVILHGQNWFKDVCNAQISTAIAIAFVVFAAGSVMAMANIVSPEVGSYADAGLAHTARAQTKVLGVTTPVIDDTALEAADPSGKVSARPAGFDSTIGRWNYNLSYFVANLPSAATLTIGTFAVKSGITASGSAQTGPILKSGMVYHMSLWITDSLGTKEILARADIKTGKAKGPGNGDTGFLPCLPPTQTSTSTPVGTSTPSSALGFCVKGQDGKISCSPRLCGSLTPKSGDSLGSPLGQSQDNHLPPPPKPQSGDQ